jgi:hypothetical protein
MIQGCKKIDLKLHHPADAQLRAPLVGHWRLRCAVAWPTGAQGQGPKGPRVKSLAHRPREAEPDAAAAIAGQEAAAISCPHAPGVVVPGAAAKNPVRASRRFPS